VPLAGDDRSSGLGRIARRLPGSWTRAAFFALPFRHQSDESSSARVPARRRSPPGAENRQWRQSQTRSEERSQGRQEGRQRRPPKEATTPRAESKGAKILELNRAAQGRKLGRDPESHRLVSHSVRGFLSTAAEKHGLKIESTKTEAGDRLYQARNRTAKLGPHRGRRPRGLAAFFLGFTKKY
jgi:hypothetical protein